jgi:hypothetical protein
VGLAEQLNPEKEALCIAVDKNIYVWAYDKPQKIGEAGLRIGSLATKNTRLVHSDGTGIYDSLANKVLCAPSLPIWKIATAPSGVLIGASHPEFGGLFAMINGHEKQLILEAETEEQVAERVGTTNFLAGQPFLMDAGNYVANNALGAPIPDSSLYETQQNRIAVHGRLYGIEQFTGVAATDKADELYVALNTCVERRTMYEMDPDVAQEFNKMIVESAQNELFKKKPDVKPVPVSKKELLFQLTSPVYKQYRSIAELGNYFVNKPLTQEGYGKVWAELNNCIDALKFLLPKSHLKLKYHDRKPAIDIKPVPYAEAKAYYAPVLEAIAQQQDEAGFFDEPEERHPLTPLFGIMLGRVKEQCFSKYGISAMAKCNDKLAIGLGTGELVMRDPASSANDAYVVWHFGKPIAAMLTIPLEVYNDGIRQHVLERIRQRAYFAGHGKVYKFEGVPQPLRKAV